MFGWLNFMRLGKSSTHGIMIILSWDDNIHDIFSHDQLFHTRSAMQLGAVIALALHQHTN